MQNIPDKFNVYLHLSPENFAHAPTALLLGHVSDLLVTETKEFNPSVAPFTNMD